MVESGYSTFLLAEEATQLIERHDGSRPFFLYLAFNAAHRPDAQGAPPEYIEHYAHLPFPAQRAQLKALDDALGWVIDALDRKALLDDTLVVFLNDNGGTERAGGNRPYRGVKGQFYEGGIRVPAVMRWPGRIPAGSESDALLHAVDIFPTLAGQARAPTGGGLPLDGRDAWQALNLDGTAPDRHLLASLHGLRRLSLRNNGIDDLAALAGLEELDVGDNLVQDLSPLAGLTALRVLWADRNRVSDLWPLASLAGLEALDLGANLVRDLRPLAGLGRLKALRLGGNGVSAGGLGSRILARWTACRDWWWRAGTTGRPRATWTSALGGEAADDRGRTRRSRAGCQQRFRWHRGRSCGSPFPERASRMPRSAKFGVGERRDRTRCRAAPMDSDRPTLPGRVCSRRLQRWMENIARLSRTSLGWSGAAGRFPTRSKRRTQLPGEHGAD